MAGGAPCRAAASRLAALVLGLVVLWLGTAAAEAPTTPIYRVGVVPQREARQVAGVWLPILEELQARTGLRLELSGVANIPEFEAGVVRGDFDFAYMSPYHFLVARDSQGYVPLVRDGSRSLAGILVVPADSPITSPAELAGATVAFPAPNALGASLLVQADLREQYRLSYTPLYAQTHSSAYLNVVMGLAQAAGGVPSTLALEPPKVRDQLRVLHTTRTVPPHPVTAHPRVPAAHQASIRAALLALSTTPEGRALLSRVPLEAPVAATAADYAPLAAQLSGVIHGD